MFFTYYLVTYSPKCPFPWHRGTGGFLSWRCCARQPTHLHILGTHLKNFRRKLNLYAVKQSDLLENNIMLFNKGGEGLNRKKKLEAMHFICNFYSTIILVVLKGLFLMWNFQMIINVYVKTLFAIRPSHQQITG